MSDDDALKSAKDGVALVGELLKVAGDNPNVKEAANNLGQSALTITKTINNALLPLAAINFAFDKARAYFNGRFQQDLAEKAASIPAENIVEPKASMAGPALQGLAFTHEEPDLKSMYLNLLATSMDGRVSATAHPAFVEVIKQLDAEEARLLRGILRSPRPIPIAQVRATETAKKSFRVLASHLLDLRSGADRSVPAENPRLPAMVDNWIRLGLVEVTYGAHLIDDARYTWVEERPEFARLRAGHENDQWKVTHQRGYIERTRLGCQFAAAVGLL